MYIYCMYLCKDVSMYVQMYVLYTNPFSYKLHNKGGPIATPLLLHELRLYPLGNNLEI